MLEFHHIGLLVKNISKSVKHYSLVYGTENISKITRIHSEKVKVCFVKIGDNSFIELVEPTSERIKRYRLMKKRISYYHIGYKVDDIGNEVRRLESLNYKSLYFFNSEAFDGKKCIFLISPEAHLIELIEK